MNVQSNAPLFRDPLYDGAADPTVIYNEKEKNWWMLYTQRRPNLPTAGVSSAYGCRIGVAVSDDGGEYWYYRGTLDLEFEFGHNTFWAPEVIYANGLYHMYVTYIRGIHSKWKGDSRILYYTSKDIMNWKLEGPVEIPSERAIDACIFPLPDHKYRMWYKDERLGSHIVAADSDDLHQWSIVGEAITDCASEGPNVFEFQGKYYMIVDCWDGFGVYQSEDLIHWIRQPENILRNPGKRPFDGSIGLHGDVVVSKGRAYIFYFTHPNRTSDFLRRYEGMDHIDIPVSMNVTAIQVAELVIRNGFLVCDRDQDFVLDL
ncbi:MAG: hypothetical protein K0S47_103 [Herbinix sp.]|jgi:sucrose-6-phosphate hydrolase SacC (GH32 family)|nr:hypothetical protein [Herbinix sp.]